MNDIGRNSPCPCGSGKKYKQCCLKLAMISIPERIHSLVDSMGYNPDIASVLYNMHRYMEAKQWIGACHAISSALYVALSEIGATPRLCIGEVAGDGFVFDHSWLELDGKIIDLAINRTLLDGQAASGIIILGQDISTGKPPLLRYGVSETGIEGEAALVLSTPFATFMDNFPGETNGLWGVVQTILQKPIDLRILHEKYSEVNRVFVHSDKC